MSMLARFVPAIRNASSRGIYTSGALNNIFKIQTSDEFQEKVLKSKSPVVVDFFATWCGPCKMLTPRIESVVTEVKGVTLAKVDIDEHNELAFDFDVSSVPVLVGMKDGKEVARMVGLQDTDKLKKFVESIANSK